MTRSPGPVPISYGARLRSLAVEHPDELAIVFAPAGEVERQVTWLELEQTSNRAARLLAEHGVVQGSLVAIGLPNSVEHFIATYAVWKLGGLPLPLRAALPHRERDAILSVAKPTLVISIWDDVPLSTLPVEALHRLENYSTDPLPDRISNPGRALASGGSTGTPKIIVTPGPWARVPGIGAGPMAAIGVQSNAVNLVSGPLYHTMPFMNSYTALFDGNKLIVMDRFDATRTLNLIERHRVTILALTPTMMRRLLSLSDLQDRDLSSIQLLLHGAGPCPPWVKQAWIDLLGAERVTEVYSAAEGTGMTLIRGDEWLEHPGSVGKAVLGELAVLDDEQHEVPPGEIGYIYMRPQMKAGSHSHTGFEYIGARPPSKTADGFIHIGDMGWLDEDGYLYLADRREDLIITGDANVFPAEVEMALSSHVDVDDVVVIGVLDEQWGQRVHAIVQLVDPQQPLDTASLNQHCREHLAAYKCPKTYEHIERLPRTAAGKIRRSALVAERRTGWTAEMARVGN